MNDLDLAPLPDSTPVRWAFWKRGIALYLDIALLELVALILGLVFFDPLTGLGYPGLLLGLAIPVLYFGWGNSSLGQGQTLGKRWMKIRVVNQNGALLDLKPACLRAGFLALLLFPFLRVGLYAVNLDSWVRVGEFLPNLGAAISLYLFLLNRRTRQTLHDLIFHTYVIQTTGSTAVKAHRIWPWHLVISLALGVAIALVFFTINAPRPDPGLAVAPLPIEQTLAQKLHLRSARLLSSTYRLNQQVQSRTLRTILEPDSGKISADQLADQAAKIVLKQYPEIRQFDTLGLTVKYGYRLGLATGYREVNYRYCPRQDGKLDQRFEAQLILKTPFAYHLILNADRNYQPIFIKLLVFTTGSNPADIGSIGFQPLPLGQCKSPPRRP